MNNLWDLKGRKALITGGTQGIGKAIAEVYLQKGAEVFISARDAENIEQLLSNWRSLGYVAHGAVCDVTQADQREHLINQVENLWDSLDILVNNVGPNFKKFFFDYTLDEYELLMTGNATAAFHLSKLCYLLLKKSKQASIINISGISSSIAFKGSGPYGMAKAGLESFTRTLATELGQWNIRANAILPGFTATDTFLSKYDDEYIRKAEERIPLKRMAKAEDIANLACFLAMPSSSYITGQCITIDGGFTSYGFSGTNGN